MDLDFIGDKLKQFGSDVVNGTTDAFDAATHALGSVFSPGTPPGGSATTQGNSQQTQQQAPAPKLSTSAFNINNPLSQQMVNPQQQTDQSTPPKLDFGQTPQPTQQSGSLNTNLVDFTKPTQPVTTAPNNNPLGNIKTTNLPGSFNATPHPTNQSPGAVGSFLGAIGNTTIKPALSQIEQGAKGVPGLVNIAGGISSFNPTQIKQGLHQARPLATEARQVAQGTAQMVGGAAKSIFNPQTNTTPVTSTNRLSNIVFGKQPVESIQQQAHNTPGGTAAKAGVTTALVGTDILSALGAKAGFDSLSAKVAPEAPVDPDIADAVTKITKTAKPTAPTITPEEASLNATEPRATATQEVDTLSRPEYRNADAERAAKDVLDSGGGRKAAVKAYQDAVPGIKTKDAAFQVSRMARESKASISVHTPNPEDESHPLPTAKPGEFNRPSINRQIVQSTADDLGKKAITALDNLTDNDRANFQDYLENTKDITKADKPEDVQTAIDASKKLTDTGNALDHEVGGTTPHVENYFPGYIDHTDPEVLARDRLQAAQDIEEELGPKQWNNTDQNAREQLINNRMAEMQNEQSFTSDNENYGGFKNQRREFTTRVERQKAGIKDLYDDPRDSIKRYVQGLKFKVGNQAYINAAQEADKATEGIPQHDVNLGGNMGVKVSDEAYKTLSRDDIDAGSRSPLSKGNALIKKVLISTGMPHLVIVPQQFLGALSALKGANAITDALNGDVDIDNPPTPDISNAEFGARIDSPLRSHNLETGAADVTNIKGVAGKVVTAPTRFVYGYLLPQMHDILLGAAKDYMDAHNIDYDSPEAQNIGHQINSVLGYAKTGNGAFDQSTFAPALIKSTAQMYADAARSGGLVARGGVLGQQMANQFLGIISKNISNAVLSHTGKNDSNKQYKIKDNAKSTFFQEIFHPSIYTPFVNKKGENVRLSLPGQYQAKALNIPLSTQRGANGQIKVVGNSPAQMASNTAQTAKDIASPVISAGLNAITNQTYNGQQVRNPYAPIPTQIAQATVNAASNTLPINFQSIANRYLASHLPSSVRTAINANQNNGPNALSLAGNTLGLNPQADTTSGPGPAIQTYYNGIQKGANYIGANSGNQTDTANNEALYQKIYARDKNAQGQTILLGPKEALANAADLASNTTVLQGYMIAQKANGKGNYNPIFDHPVNQVQVYEEYEAIPKGDPNRTVMEQKYPFLINMFNEEQSYFANSKFKSTAVPGADYVAYPPISTAQSNLMTQADQLASIQNRTPAQETQLTNLENNTSLQAAYTMLDNYTNTWRSKVPGLQPIPYPAQNMTPSQEALLQQEEALPTGTGQKSALIKANQNQWNALTQIMADDTQYNIEKYGGVVSQGGTEPDLLKDESDIGQDIAVGTNAAGQKEYQLNPALAYNGGTSGGFTFAQGSGSGGSGSSSTSSPLVPMPKIKRGKTPKMRKPPKLHGFRAPHIRKSANKPVRVSGAHPVQVAKPTAVVKLASA